MGNLTAAKIRNIDKGKHADGNGLYLDVRSKTKRYWVQRVVVDDKRTWKGLGKLDDVSLTQARIKSEENRVALRAGRNPWAKTVSGSFIGHVNGRSTKRGKPTFGEMAEDHQSMKLKAYGDADHVLQRFRDLKNVAGKIWEMDIDEITAVDVLNILEPRWVDEHDKLRRARRRMVEIFARAKVAGYAASNPADDVKDVLPKAVKKTRHYASLPFEDVPGKLVDVRLRECYLNTRLCFEFIVLTAVRNAEARGARWCEIDLAERVWTIPAERTKQRKQHRVALSRQAVFLLQHHRDSLGDDYIFTSPTNGRPLSENVFRRLTHRKVVTRVKDARGRVRFDTEWTPEGFTMHGMRSSFKTWSTVNVVASHSAIERALAHEVPNTVEAAYFRSDMLKERFPLMQAWADFCDPPLF